MKLLVTLDSRAALQSGEKPGTYEIEIDAEYLSSDIGELLAARLFDDCYICEGVVDDEGKVGPNVINGQPVLLTVDGTEESDLIAAIQEDQETVEETLAEIGRRSAA